MYPAFHVAIPLIISDIKQIKEKYRINRLVLIISSLLPDMLDKPLELLQISVGKLYIHNLLFLFSSTLLLFFLSKKNKPITYTYFVGYLMHLILDIPVDIFFPIILFEIPIHINPVGFWLVRWTTVFIVNTEIIGAIFLLVLFIKYQLYKRKAVLRFFKVRNTEFLRLYEGKERLFFKAELCFIVFFFVISTMTLLFSSILSIWDVFTTIVVFWIISTMLLGIWYYSYLITPKNIDSEI